MLNPNFTSMQAELWEAAMRFKRLLVITGRRAGKTHMFLYLLAHVAIHKPGARCWYITPNFPLARPQAGWLTNILAEADELKDHNRQEHTWTTRGGGMIQFKSGDTPETIRGWDCDLVVIDEASLCKELVFINADIALNIRKGLLVVGSNVPELDHPGYGWVTRLRNEWEQSADAWVGIYPSWVNYVTYPGQREDAKIKAIEQDLAPEIFARRIGADLSAYTGLVYKEFDPERNLVRGEYAPGNCVVGLDPGFTNPAALLFAHYDGHNLVVYDEVYQSGLTTPDICNIINTHEPRPALVVVDPSVPGLIEEINRGAGGDIAVGPPDSGISSGIAIVKSWLSNGRLKVHERCARTLYEIERYRFGPGEKPLKIHDHAMDALRYLVVTLAVTEQEARIANPEDQPDFYVLQPDPEIEQLWERF